METSEQHNDDRKSEKEIAPKEKLVQNLIDMGFPKAVVLQVIRLNVLLLKNQ